MTSVQSQRRTVDRVEVLVGRKGKLVFFLYPMQLDSGFPADVFDAYQKRMGLDPGRFPLRLKAFYLAREGEPVHLPEGLTIAFGDDERIEATATKARMKPGLDAGKQAVWRVWAGGPATIQPGHEAQWLFQVQGSVYPPHRKKPVVHARFACRVGNVEKTVYLQAIQVERRSFLSYLRDPGDYLLDIEQIAMGFRADE